MVEIGLRGGKKPLVFPFLSTSSIWLNIERPLSGDLGWAEIADSEAPVRIPLALPAYGGSGQSDSVGTGGESSSSPSRSEDESR